MPTTSHQRCHIHQLPLVAGGRRYGIRGLYWPPSYFRVCNERFPRANAHRIGACAGRLKGRSVGPFCPACREELRAWCVEEIERSGDSRELAQGMLTELFSEPSV